MKLSGLSDISLMVLAYRLYVLKLFRKPPVTEGLVLIENILSLISSRLTLYFPRVYSGLIGNLYLVLVSICPVGDWDDRPPQSNSSSGFEQR